jgi:putative ABC transport system permease protein
MRPLPAGRGSCWILLGSVLAVLLVACTNVENLLLARTSGRQRELTVRAALGASPARLIRQNLTESLLLGIIGGTIGCWVAYSLLQLFESIAPEGIPRLRQAGLDTRVVLFTLGVSLMSGVLFGLAPAMRKPAVGLLTGKEASQTSRGLLRQILVASQVAVSLILLTGAGLLLHSLLKFKSVPLGMDAESVVSAQVPLAEYRYPDAKHQLAFFDELERRLNQMPGITAMRISDTLPPSGGTQATIYSRIEVAGRTHSPEGTGGMVGWRSVTPGYFMALGVRIIPGRGFRDADRGQNQNPIILSETFREKLFPNEDPLGKSLRIGAQAPWREVVEIAADVRNNGLARPSDPEYYIPWKFDTEGHFRVAHVTLPTPMNPETGAKRLRQETASLDPSVPVTMETMTEGVGKLSERPRFNAVLLTLLAGMGVALAAIGVCGEVGFHVSERTREIGVRMALGASPKSILTMIMGNVVRWTIAGVGLVGSWYAVGLLQSLLFEVSRRDPWPVVAALALLLVAAFLVRGCRRGGRCGSIRLRRCVMNSFYLVTEIAGIG